jgi:phage-related protein
MEEVVSMAKLIDRNEFNEIAEFIIQFVIQTDLTEIVSTERDSINRVIRKLLHFGNESFRMRLTEIMEMIIQITGRELQVYIVQAEDLLLGNEFIPFERAAQQTVSCYYKSQINEIRESFLTLMEIMKTHSEIVIPFVKQIVEVILKRLGAVFSTTLQRVVFECAPLIVNIMINIQHPDRCSAILHLLTGFLIVMGSTDLDICGTLLKSLAQLIEFYFQNLQHDSSISILASKSLLELVRRLHEIPEVPDGIDDPTDDRPDDLEHFCGILYLILNKNAPEALEQFFQSEIQDVIHFGTSIFVNCIWTGHVVFGSSVTSEMFTEVWTQIVLAIQNRGFRALCASLDLKMPFKLATVIIRVKIPPFEMILPILEVIQEIWQRSAEVVLPFFFVLIRKYSRRDLIEFLFALVAETGLKGIDAVFPDEIAADFCAILAEVPAFVEALRSHPDYGKELFAKFQSLVQSEELNAAQMAVFPVNEGSD